MATQSTSNRRVRLCRFAPRRPGPGGHPILYAFSFDDLGMLLGLRQGTVRKLALKGRFDPTDLTSIAEFWAARRPVAP